MNTAYSYNRTAAAPAGSLLDAKLAWANQLAEAMATRFKTYGGWTRFKVKTEIRTARSTVTLTVRSDSHGWTGTADINVGGDVTIHASNSVDAKIVKDFENIDLLKMMQEIDNDATTIRVNEAEPAQKAVEAVSLWFSKPLNEMPWNG
jgi:hypothetical protein